MCKERSASVGVISNGIFESYLLFFGVCVAFLATVDGHAHTRTKNMYGIAMGQWSGATCNLREAFGVEGEIR